jgi:hypothetical protein
MDKRKRVSAVEDGGKTQHSSLFMLSSKSGTDVSHNINMVMDDKTGICAACILTKKNLKSWRKEDFQRRRVVNVLYSNALKRLMRCNRVINKSCMNGLAILVT